MPGEKKSKAERLLRRERIAALRLKSWTLPMIAKELGASLPTIKREMRIIEIDWRESAIEDISAVKARELRKLDDLEAEARAEWERSKKDWQKKVVEDRPGKNGGKHAKIETGDQTGDPRYLTAIMQIHDRRARLLGTDAPAKIAPTTPSGGDFAASFATAMVEAMEKLNK